MQIRNWCAHTQQIFSSKQKQKIDKYARSVKIANTALFVKTSTFKSNVCKHY